MRPAIVDLPEKLVNDVVTVVCDKSAGSIQPSAFSLSTLYYYYSTVFGIRYTVYGNCDTSGSIE